MIPLFHDFHDKQVVIVGGGSVALRKARRFVQEAEVTVIGQDFEDGFHDVECKLKHKRITPQNVRQEITGVYLVIPATDDPELNATVEAISKREDCLVNRVDEVGDVVVPSCIRSEELSVAVSTGGSSPAMSKYLRQLLTPVVERADGMVRIQRKLRTELEEDIRSQKERKRLLWQVIESDEVWEHLPQECDRAEAIARELVRK